MVKCQWHTQQTYATAVGLFGTHYSTSTAVYATNGASASNFTTLPPAAGAGNGVVVLSTVQSCACLRKTVTKMGVVLCGCAAGSWRGLKSWLK